MIKIKDGLYKIHFENSFFFSFLQESFDDCEQKKNVAFIKIQNMTPLKSNMTISYTQALHFFEDVGKQMAFLKKKGYYIPTFSVSDFCICDERFVFLNEDNIIKLTADGEIIISKPFTDKTFFSPEMTQIKKLPDKCSNSSWMFSIAVLIATLMKLKHGEKFNWRQHTIHPTLEQFSPKILSLEAIYNTKLYWALERCLIIDYKKRYYYLI
jgi:hypothetical protein